MIPHWEARNPRFWFAVALALLSGCASACGGAVETSPPSSDAELADAGCHWQCPGDASLCAVAVLVCDGDR